MVEQIELDQNAFKAIAVDTRLDILKQLKDKKQTLSELSQSLELSKPTIKEHLDILEQAKLITKESTQRKWKYYSLSEKGLALLNPREVKVLFAFAINIIALFGALAYGIKTFFIQKAPQMFAANIAADSVVDSGSIAAREMAPKMATTTTQTALFFSWSEIIFALIIVVLAFSAGIIFGLYLKRNKFYKIVKNK